MALINNPTKFYLYNFIIKEKNLLITKEHKLPSQQLFTNIQKNFPNINYFAEEELNYAAFELQCENPYPNELIEIPIRQFFSLNPESLSLSARAKSISSWNKSMQFCPTCGTKLELCKTFTAKDCPNCKRQIFPQIEPCVIVLVNKEDKILLARHVQRNQDIYTCIAGFIEAGESAEEAVIREVKEEVGINVKNIKYKGSQGWPFPDQLMLAFTAEYESGTIKLQEDELSEAKWFSKENLPATPLPGSVAYKLINSLFD